MPEQQDQPSIDRFRTKANAVVRKRGDHAEEASGHKVVQEDLHWYQAAMVIQVEGAELFLTTLDAS